MHVLAEMFFRFFCCGLFAIGGGLATLPFLYDISEATGLCAAQAGRYSAEEGHILCAFGPTHDRKWRATGT